MRIAHETLDEDVSKKPPIPRPATVPAPPPPPAGHPPPPPPPARTVLVHKVDHSGSNHSSMPASPMAHAAPLTMAAALTNHNSLDAVGSVPNTPGRMQPPPQQQFTPGLQGSVPQSPQARDHACASHVLSSCVLWYAACSRRGGGCCDITS